MFLNCLNVCSAAAPQSMNYWLIMGSSYQLRLLLESEFSQHLRPIPSHIVTLSRFEFGLTWDPITVLIKEMKSAVASLRPPRCMDESRLFVETSETVHDKFLPNNLSQILHCKYYAKFSIR